MKAADLDAVLAQGAVLYARLRTVTSPEPHFCIVMNASPASDECIVLTVVSSKTDTTIRRVAALGQPPETLVRITPKDYPPLKVDSVVNCNDPKRDTLFSLRAEAAAGGVKICPPMPPEIVARLVAGMRASALVRDSYKALLGASQP